MNSDFNHIENEDPDGVIDADHPFGEVVIHGTFSCEQAHKLGLALVAHAVHWQTKYRSPSHVQA